MAYRLPYRSPMFACRRAPLVLPEGVVRDLAARYAEPHRAYHTAAHVAEVLRWYDAIADDLGWHDGVAVYLAVVFHDAVYDPTRRDNEERSALLARDLVAAPDRTLALIRLTAQHGALDAAALDADAQLFLDSDTAILGAEPAAFDAYDAAIRREYAHVPDDAYRAGRGAFLRALHDRPRIFLSDYFHARLDLAARDNLHRALARLASAR